VNLTRIANTREDEEWIKNKLEEFAKWFLEEDYRDVQVVYNKLLELSVDLYSPWSTPGHRVSLYDSGGDYPRGKLEFEYYG